MTNGEEPIYTSGDCHSHEQKLHCSTAGQWTPVAYSRSSITCCALCCLKTSAPATNWRRPRMLSLIGNWTCCLENVMRRRTVWVRKDDISCCNNTYNTDYKSTAVCWSTTSRLFHCCDYSLHTTQAINALIEIGTSWNLTGRLLLAPDDACSRNEATTGVTVETLATLSTVHMQQRLGDASRRNGKSISAPNLHLWSVNRSLFVVWVVS